ncbi:GNAT family N-acetyltransferase [Arcticibacterium luteifluviistationis]|uniref:GNAT family N-acetyltransferase n=2 Tax=Arcticibacterium luteifluviistationis TaxID=1784714 RepID=A0A2Z4GHU0_9BACT|nr:GNAT family N-acetyltransferase [Arcticibacterium luteifluviistationis]
MGMLVQWSEAEKEAFIDQQFGSQHSHYQTHFGDGNFDVILQGEVKVGRLYLRENEAEILIIDIAILSKYRRQGIGNFILKNIIEEAFQKKKPVKIHVEKNNPALSLYYRLGFKAIEDKGVYLYMEKSYEGSISKKS